MVVLCFSPLRELVFSGLALYTEFIPTARFLRTLCSVHGTLVLVPTNVLGPELVTRKLAIIPFVSNLIPFRGRLSHQVKSDAMRLNTDGLVGLSTDGWRVRALVPSPGGNWNGNLTGVNRVSREETMTPNAEEKGISMLSLLPVQFFQENWVRWSALEL